jgi:hypothetical protein
MFLIQEPLKNKLRLLIEFFSKEAKIMLKMKKNSVRNRGNFLIWGFLILLLTMSACLPVQPAEDNLSDDQPIGPESTPTAEQPEISPGESKPAPPVEEVLPILTPESEIPVISEVPDTYLESLYEFLQTNYSIEKDDLTLIRAESVIWPDGSLGCPQPGMMYTQALVEGYWVQFQHSEKMFDFRLSQKGTFILCDQLGMLRDIPPGTPTQ